MKYLDKIKHIALGVVAAAGVITAGVADEGAGEKVGAIVAAVALVAQAVIAYVNAEEAE